MSARAALALCLWSCVVACGPPAPVNIGGTAPGVGDTCATSGDVCQPGLVCGPLGTCDWGSCRDAPDPAGWCAGQLGVAPARVVCDVDGRCAVLRGAAGEPCAADDGCYAGLVCEQGSCVTLCASSATCPGEASACVERAPGASQRICGPAPDCNKLPDPVGFCADKLGVSAGQVVCAASGRCELMRAGAGSSCERDRECELGLVCEDRRCERPCEGSCEDATLTCSPRSSGGAGSVCRYVPRGCALAEQPYFYCYLETGWDYTECDLLTGLCLQEPPPPPPVYYSLLIKDVSSPQACAARTPEGLRAPGADIVSIEVYASDGTLLSLPSRPSWALVGSDNDFVAPDLLASSERAAQLGAQEPVCPLLRQADGRLELGGMLSLGCGGRLVVGFAPAGDVSDGAGVAVTRGMRLRIGEYAPVCDGGAEPDPDAYTVTLCESDVDDRARCTLSLTPEPARGTVWLDVP